MRKCVIAAMGDDRSGMLFWCAPKRLWVYDAKDATDYGDKDTASAHIRKASRQGDYRRDRRDMYFMGAPLEIRYACMDVGC